MAKAGFRNLWVAALLVVAACPSPPVAPTDASDGSVLPPSMQDAAPAPEPDGASSDLYDQACTKLAHLGCPEGTSVPGGRSCAATLRADARLYDFGPARLKCWRAAATKQEARACGKLTCP